MRWGLIAAVLVVTAGCAPQLATVRAEPEAPAVPGPARGEASFVVRTAETGPTGVSRPVAGADCIADAAGYRARFVTPARVFVPDFGPRSPVVQVRCEDAGRVGEALAAPRPVRGVQGFRAWPSLGLTLSSGGDVGVGVGAALTPVTAPRRVTYGDVRVMLR